ncbi:hypothetical protein BBJ29_001977 [Phytophthora kernoviae]|uniref:N-acetyltransferase domain-containing protein n=1 Tax=Phytophthora kernoviae TaxID=325452 RepID=A0A3F2RRD9_9STRA|nr:hypothetical protein BBP00_00004565 [Phytophthora kernoviae]RLN67596.1 hypothetical protein BBJ29_001977 [Phytophthora kernoviae]
MLTPAVMLGIAAGALVFVGSLLAVFMLLRYGGSFDRMSQEAVGLPAKLGEQKPLLYDELLEKSRMLSTRPPPLGAGTLLEGKFVCVRDFDAKKDVADLFAISCGEPLGGIFRDLTYDADEMIWKYLAHGPFASVAEFQRFYSTEATDARRYVLVDREGRQPIGMVTLGEHSPKNLRVELEDLWLSPAFQGSAALPEVVLLLLTHLFSKGYRRVEWRCDGHNVLIFAAINSEWAVMEEHLLLKLRQALEKSESSKSNDGSAGGGEEKKTR